MGKLLEAQKNGKEVGEVSRLDLDAAEIKQTLAEDRYPGHAAWLDWPWKLHRINGERFELYNLTEDPMETTDLSKDPDHTRRFKQMKKELDGWMRSVVRSLNGKDYKRE